MWQFEAAALPEYQYANVSGSIKFAPLLGSGIAA
jgi:hypothetical protein